MMRYKVAPALAILSVLVTASPAVAAADFNGTVSPGKPFTWDGNIFVAANVGDPAACGKDPSNYCDTALIRFDYPVPDDALPPPSIEPQTVTVEGAGRVSLDNYFPFPECDFDLFVYSSDETGTVGDLLGSSTGSVGVLEKVTVPLTSTATVNPDGSVVRQESTYVLVRVVYWFVPGSRYSGTAKIL